MPARATPAVVPRFDAIDLLRGFSILLVVVHHTWLRFFFLGNLRMGAALTPWTRRLLFFNGQNAVTLFFAISGFLITLTSTRRFGSLARLEAGRFYRIRFARIAPLLLATVAVLSALSLLHLPDFRVQHVSLGHAVFAALTFHLNWLEAHYGYLPANWDVLWSLSIEELFYLLFPLACLALLRGRHRPVAFFLLLTALILAGPFARTVWTTNDIWRDTTYLGGTDAIALGCLTALLAVHLEGAQRPPSRTLLHALHLLGVGLMALILAQPTWPMYQPFGQWLDRTGLYATVLPLGTCCTLLATTLRRTPGTVWTAPVRWFGRHSYEVYLTHEFVVIALTRLMLRLHRGQPWLWAVAIVALAALLGWAVTRFFSEPANRALRGAAPPSQPSSRKPAHA